MGDTSDTPKREGQASPPCHVDIEASPSPTVTRVTHGNSQMERPSWTWRCLQMFIALLVVIFTTWLAIAFGSQESWDISSYGVYGGEVAALMVSTGIAGLAAMWLYLIAPTAHTLLAARFLLLNWVEGLVKLSSIAAGNAPRIHYSRSKLGWASLLLRVRTFLLLFEFVGLQFLIQNRLQSLWPALNRPGCKVWLARCLRTEVAIAFLWTLNISLLNHLPMSSGSIIWECMFFTSTLFMCCIPACFLIWSVLVATTLFRVVWMFQKALNLTRKQGLAVAATFQACRGRSILQCAGVIISLTTSAMLSYYLYLFGWKKSVGAFHDSIVPHCINLLVNAAGIILLSGASSLITNQGTLRFPPLRCCRCPCRFRRCCGFKSLCRSNLKIGEENAWEKKTRELANRGISLEELLAFY